VHVVGPDAWPLTERLARVHPRAAGDRPRSRGAPTPIRSGAA